VCVLLFLIMGRALVAGFAGLFASEFRFEWSALVGCSAVSLGLCFRAPLPLLWHIFSKIIYCFLYRVDFDGLRSLRYLDHLLWVF